MDACRRSIRVLYVDIAPYTVQCSAQLLLLHLSVEESEKNPINSYTARVQLCASVPLVRGLRLPSVLQPTVYRHIITGHVQNQLAGREPGRSSTRACRTAGLCVVCMYVLDRARWHVNTHTRSHRISYMCMCPHGRRHGMLACTTEQEAALDTLAAIIK
jgi:hypothetical protein